MKISTDNWKGVYSNEEIFELTNTDFLLNCIDELNGKNKTSIGLSNDDNEETYLVVGGGNDDKFSVVGGKNGDIYNLINKNNSNKT